MSRDDSRKSVTEQPPRQLQLTEKGASPQILISSYNETATDALGRKLLSHSEVGSPKKDKYVGLFYLIWSDSFGGSTLDVTKAYACDPEYPDLGRFAQFCWWSEPETGYHRSDDVWQIKRDMRYFAMAGIDFLYLDFTNGILYEPALRALLDTCLELRAAGQMTPYFVPWSLGESNRNAPGYGIVDIYDIFYKDPKYDELWFRWEGKPLVMLKNDGSGKLSVFDDPELTDFFTFRISWPGYAWPGEPVGSGYKFWGDGWLANFEYFYGYTDDPKRSECVGIGCAGFATGGSGRSGRELSKHEYLDRFLETPTMEEGIMLRKNYEEMLEKNPETDVLLISRWNEWAAQNIGHLDFGFVDQFNREYSRDIAPMKGGHTDNYFYQMCNIIRHFKGVLPPDEATDARTVDLDGDFAAWQSVTPVFYDFEGDTEPRDIPDVSGSRRYVNATGRNDIVETRMTADGDMLYAYVRTAAPITDYREGKHWMMLFLNTDGDSRTGWNGYDYVLNYEVVSEWETTLCAYRDHVWQEIGRVRYRVEGSEMMLEIPRAALGLTEDTITVDFHWMDNVTDVYDLHSWFTTGDSAPERRNDYTLTLKAPFDAAAKTCLPPRENGVRCMPAVDISGTETSDGLFVTVYTLPESYGKMPNLEHIAANARSTALVRDISAEAAGVSEGNVALSFDGYIYLPEDGVYDFAVSTEDCARVYIDGRLATEVMSPSAREVKQPSKALGALRLAKGYHTFRLAYAEIDGHTPRLLLDGQWQFRA